MDAAFYLNSLILGQTCSTIPVQTSELELLQRFIAMDDLAHEQMAQQVISGFYEDEVPTFRQGYPIHELEDVVTAGDVTAYMGKIQELKLEILRLRAALTEVVFASRTKISMKQVARAALFPTKEVPNAPLN